MKARRPRIMAAVAPDGEPLARRSLAGDAELVFADSYAHAVSLLGGREKFDLILAGAHFDDSRMFDLLRHWDSHRRDIPFVCCRMVGRGPVPPVFVEGLRVAVETSGCAFIDYLAIADKSGHAAAAQALRKEVFAALRLPG
jgi:hypothetical protein